jgi:hypothetical protein
MIPLDVHNSSRSSKNERWAKCFRVPDQCFRIEQQCSVANNMIQCLTLFKILKINCTTTEMLTEISRTAIDQAAEPSINAVNARWQQGVFSSYQIASSLEDITCDAAKSSSK